MPRTLFYIESDGVYYELDATVTATVRESGRLTRFPVEDGNIISDHFSNDLVSIDLEGSITSAKALLDALAPHDYIAGIREIKQSGKPVKVYMASRGRLRPLENCVIVNFEYTNDKEHGVTALTSSYSIKLSLQQVIISARAKLVQVRDVVIADQVAETEDSGNSTTRELTTQEKIDAIQQENVNLIKENIGFVTSTYKAIGKASGIN